MKQMPNDAMTAPASSPTSSTPTPTSVPTPASPTSAGSNGSSSGSSAPQYDKISGETPNDPDEVFSGLGGDFEVDLDAPSVPSAAPAAPASTPAPAAAKLPVQTAAPQVPPPASPAAATQPQEVAPAPAPAQAPAAAAPEGAAATEAPTDVPPAEIDTLLTALNEKAADVLQHVLPQFQLTPEQITELETDAAGSVPKLLASTYLKSLQASVQVMKEIIPSMIAQTIARAESAREMETAFFKQWNLLDRTKHGNDIRMFAKTFAAANPKITQSELFSLVGAAVMAKHGIAGGTAPAPSAPAASTPHFVPATASGPVVTHQTPVDQNPFSGMGRNFDEE